MANWINPKQDWTAKSHPVDTDFNRIEGNAAYLKGQVDDKQSQIDAIKNGVTAVPEAIHAGTANNALTTNGDITFQYSGVAAGDYPVNAYSHLIVGRYYRIIPAGNKLVLHRANICTPLSALTFKIGIALIPQESGISPSSYPWSAPNYYDNTPNTIIYTATVTQGIMLFMTFYNSSGSSIGCGGSTWWLDCAIQ